MNTARTSAIAISTAASLALAGCVSAPPDDPREITFADIGHVHDLSYDDATDTLYIASHYGLYMWTAEELSGPLGGHGHDFMGFARATEGEMIAGGHPDAASGWGNHMGFAVSDDTGETWESLSLTGEVDFHDIEFTANGYVGYDSQTSGIIYSEDGVTWEQRNVVPTIDLAVSPDGNDTWVLTTPDAVVITLDGALTFGVFENAPAGLISLAWPEQDSLYGITVDGTVVMTRDVGAMWETLGTAPDLGAFQATADGTLFVATSTGIYVSTDDGATWETVLG